jgi:DNA-directed RNA polymerase subunit beta'
MKAASRGNARIKIRIKEYDLDEDGTKTEKITRHDTTGGSCAPLRDSPAGLPFELINKALKKKEISKLINASFRRCGLR